MAYAPRPAARRLLLSFLAILIPGTNAPGNTPAELNRDGVVNQIDLGFMKSCRSGPGVMAAPGCEPADLDGDGDVDQDDFALLQPCLTDGETRWPTQVTLSVLSENAILVSWGAPSISAVRLVLRRYAGADGWQPLRELDPDGRHFFDTSVGPNRAYCYQIAAYDDLCGSAHTAPACVGVPPAVRHYSANPTTVTVTNEAELRNAMVLTWHSDLTVLIDREIVINGGKVHFNSVNNVIELRGIHPSAGLRFTRRWDGNWNDPNLEGENGLAFDGRHAILRDLRITGYEGRGAAVKSHVIDTFVAAGCVFEDISTIAYPPKTTPVTHSDQVWFGNAIGQSSGSHLIVDRCTFRRVATSDTYAHCIYPAAVKSMIVSNCTFEQSGQPVVTSLAKVGWLFGNTYRDLVKVPYSKSLSDQGIGVPVWSFWVNPSDNLLTAMRETFVNVTFRWPIRNYPSPVRHYFDYNDYSGIRIENDAVGPGRWLPWQSVEKPGMDWIDWRQAGFDAHSLPPGDL